MQFAVRRHLAAAERVFFGVRADAVALSDG
jgi:hypothetical protein